MKSNKMEYRPGLALCHRCEHRVRFIEGGPRPRMECGEKTAVCGCYMYRPVQPVVLVRREGDPRPVQGPCMISARTEAAGLLDALDMVVVTEEVKKDGKKAYVSLWELTKKPKRKYPEDDLLDDLLVEVPKNKKVKEKNIWVGVKKRQGVDKREPLMRKAKKC
jgi:hypothetical protein